MNTPTPIAIQCRLCNTGIAEASNKINTITATGGAATSGGTEFGPDSSLPQPLLTKSYCQRDLTRTNTLDCSKCEPVEPMKKKFLTNMLVNIITDITKIYELVRDYWNDPTDLFILDDDASLANSPYNIAPEILKDMRRRWNIVYGGIQGKGKDGQCANPLTNRSYSLQTNPLGVRSLCLLRNVYKDDMLRGKKNDVNPALLPLVYTKMIFNKNYGPGIATAKAYKNQYLFLRYMADKFSEPQSFQSHWIVLLSFPAIIIIGGKIVQKPSKEIIAQRAKMIKCLLEKENILIITFVYVLPERGSHAMALIIKPYFDNSTPPKINKIQITYFDPNGSKGEFKYLMMTYIVELLSAFKYFFYSDLPSQPWSISKWNYRFHSFRGDIRANGITFIFTPYGANALSNNEDIYKYVDLFKTPDFLNDGPDPGPGICWLLVIYFIYSVIAFSNKSEGNLDGNIVTRYFEPLNRYILQNVMMNFYVEFVLPFMKLYKRYMSRGLYKRYMSRGGNYRNASERQFWISMTQYSNEYDKIIKNATFKPSGGKEHLYYLGPPILTLSKTNKASLDMC